MADLEPGSGSVEPYSASVDLYDRFHAAEDKDYAEEADQVAALIRERRPDAANLLDAACGTGGHLEHLAGPFEAHGLDLSPAMLAEARRRLAEEVPLHLGDLRTFALPDRFDAITCLFSSIGYVRPLPEMEAAVANLVAHLSPGGVLVIEPWITPESWDDAGDFHALHIDDADGDLVRMVRSWRDGRTTSLEMHYLAGSRAGVTYEVETHLVELYTFDEYSAAFAAAGCPADVVEPGLTGRGLVVGTRA